MAPLTRPSAERRLLEHAVTAATGSTCSRLHVGAVLATPAGHILSTGFNGAPAGRPHCVHRDDRPCRRAQHAERNAIVFAARNQGGAGGAVLYLTHAPCFDCAGMIINAGISEVVYLDRYRSDEGVRELRAAGVAVRHHIREEADG